MSKVIVVGLAGPSCAGKTTVALNLIKLFPHTVVIHQDDFYRPDSQIPVSEDAGIQDWDCPSAFDMAKLVTDIEGTRSRLEALGTAHGSVKELRDHFASQWANPPESVDRLIPAEALDSLQKSVWHDLDVEHSEQIPFYIVLVDGILLFHDRERSSGGRQPQQQEHHPGDACDAGLFIYASYATLKERREARLEYSTKEGIWTDPPGYFDSIVWPNFVKYHSKFIKSYPQIAGSSGPRYGEAITGPGPLDSRIAVCSSDAPAEEVLKSCVKTIVDEWKRRHGGH